MGAWVRWVEGSLKLQGIKDMPDVTLLLMCWQKQGLLYTCWSALLNPCLKATVQKCTWALLHRGIAGLITAARAAAVGCRFALHEMQTGKPASPYSFGSATDLKCGLDGVRTGRSGLEELVEGFSLRAATCQPTFSKRNTELVIVDLLQASYSDLLSFLLFPHLLTLTWLFTVPQRSGVSGIFLCRKNYFWGTEHS